MTETTAQTPIKLNVNDWNPTEVILKQYKKNRNNAGGTVSLFSFSNK